MRAAHYHRGMPFAWLSFFGGAWLEAHAGAVAALTAAVLASWLVLDLALPAAGRARGALACLCVAGLLYLAARRWFRYDQPGQWVLLLTAHAWLLVYLTRWLHPVPAERNAPLARPIAFSGWVVIAASTALKCVSLGAWPPILTDYAAMTGLDGVALMEQGWPARAWLGQANDLQSGGKSPLHLPCLWLAFTLAGPTVAGVRLAEVIGSTVALLFFWLWVRRALAGWWAVVALALYAFSPWHLAQSRMGVYQSISLAVALALLWIGDRLLRPPPAGWPWWAGLGTAAALIGYGYAPMRILYLFVAWLLLAHLWRQRAQWLQPRLYAGPALALFLMIAGLWVQTSGDGGARRMFRTQMGGLATDTSIWHKTADGQVAQQRQPWPVVFNHFCANLLQQLQWPYIERRDQALHAPAFSVALLAAVFAVARGMCAPAFVYYLLGFLPPLLVFPEIRRSFVIHPLLLVAAAAAVRLLLERAEALVAAPWWKYANRAVVGLLLAASAVHGLHLFARDNGPVGISPSFGPIYRDRFIARIAALMPTHFVYVVNPGHLQSGIAMTLYDVQRRMGRPRYEMLHIYRNSELSQLVRADEPICFAYLAEPEREWIVDWLKRQFPQSRWEETVSEHTGQLEYAFFFVDADSFGGAPPP